MHVEMKQALQRLLRQSRAQFCQHPKAEPGSRIRQQDKQRQGDRRRNWDHEVQTGSTGCREAQRTAGTHMLKARRRNAARAWWLVGMQQPGITACTGRSSSREKLESLGGRRLPGSVEINALHSCILRSSREGCLSGLFQGFLLLQGRGGQV